MTPELARHAVVGAVAVFVANFVCAFIVLMFSARAISEPLVDGALTTGTARVIQVVGGFERSEAGEPSAPDEKPGAPQEEASSFEPGQPPAVPVNTHVLLNRVVDADLQLRAIQNAQTTNVVGMNAVFALMAIGFALFVLGAQGAFTLQSRAPQGGGQLILSATAPGLLCFALAAAVLLAIIFDQAEVNMGDFRLQPDMAAAVATADGGAGATEPGGQAEHLPSLHSLEGR